VITTFGFKNFFSFKEGGEVNFILDNGAPESLKNHGKISTVLGIKGANGSGKTNVIKAIDFLSWFCVRSANTEVDSNLLVSSYFNNPSPSDFYIEFDIDGKEYTYELRVDKTKVYEEKISKKIARTSVILLRQNDEIVKCSNEFKELKTIQLRSNASILSIIKQYKFNSDMAELFQLRTALNRIITNVNHNGLFNYKLEISNLSEQYSTDEALFTFIKKIILEVEPSIKDIQIYTFEKDDKTQFFPLFYHEVDNELKPITYNQQSSGIKSLYQNLYLYWLVLSVGGLLALDEFDIHLHALILPKLLKLFTDRKINKLNAQFIFTAHNTEIIDSLGKYRSILVDKKGNESYCYRLDEIPGSIIRNDRSIVPLYLKGKIGGIPINDQV
jgi:uncharacterized protein